MFQWAYSYSGLVKLASGNQFNFQTLMQFFHSITLVQPNCKNFERDLNGESEDCKLAVDHLKNEINKIPWDIMSFGIEHASQRLHKCNRILEVMAHFCKKEMVAFYSGKDLLAPMKNFDGSKN